MQRVKYVQKCSECGNISPEVPYQCNEVEKAIENPELLPVWCPLPGDGTKRDHSLRKYWVDWHGVFTTQPLLTCSVLTNEIAFDPDVKDWQILKTEIEKLCAFMQSDKKPYFLSWSGGNGLHIETFFDPDIYIPDDIAEGIKKYGIDAGRTVRVYIASHILEQAGVSAEVIQLDDSKIRWATDANGSMIRIFGSQRPDGGMKTLISTIPPERPKPGSLPLVFPDHIETWSLKSMQDGIIEAIRAEIESVKAQGVDPNTFEGWLFAQVEKAKAEGRIKSSDSGKKDCMGLQTALKGGIKKGHRDAVVTGIVNALRFWKKAPIDYTLAAVSKWCGTCTPPLDFRKEGIDKKIKAIYAKQRMDNSSPCNFFIEAGLCRGSQCSVLKKRP